MEDLSTRRHTDGVIVPGLLIGSVEARAAFASGLPSRTGVPPLLAARTVNDLTGIISGFEYLISIIHFESLFQESHEDLIA